MRSERREEELEVEAEGPKEAKTKRLEVEAEGSGGREEEEEKAKQLEVAIKGDVSERELRTAKRLKEGYVTRFRAESRLRNSETSSRVGEPLALLRMPPPNPPPYDAKYYGNLYLVDVTRGFLELFQVPTIHAKE